jgi:hypothetical protein
VVTRSVEANLGSTNSYPVNCSLGCFRSWLAVIYGMAAEPFSHISYLCRWERLRLHWPTTSSTACIRHVCRYPSSPGWTCGGPTVSGCNLRSLLRLHLDPSIIRGESELHPSIPSHHRFQLDCRFLARLTNSGSILAPPSSAAYAG